MIVKPTVNELLKHAENRYALVIATSKRARQISKGAKPLTDKEESSPVTIAADEIAEGKVTIVNEKEEENDNKEENEEKEEKEGDI